MPLGPKPFIPCDGVAELVAQYKSGGEKCLNVYHFKHTGGGPLTGAQLVDLKADFDAWETAYARHYRCDVTSLDRVIIRDLTVEDGAILDQASIIDGDVASPMAPQNATLAIKANTGFRGRSKHGRSYWIGMAEAHQSNGTVNGTFKAGVITNMNALILAGDSHSFELGVLSLSHAGAWRAAGVWTQIQDYSLTDDSVDSQRRRLPNH